MKMKKFDAPVEGLRARFALPTAAVFAIAMTGCAVAPTLDPPELPHAATYTAEAVQMAGASTRSPQKISLGERTDAAWWLLLNSPEINALVDLAMQHNQSLEAVKANLFMALEETASTRGSFAPQLKLGASAARGYDVATGQKAGSIEGVYRVGPSLSYQLPVFGKEQQTIAYAEAHAKRRAAELHAAQLSLSGNVVLQALEIASVAAQIESLQTMIDGDRENLKLLQRAHEAGAVSNLDLIAAQAQLDQDSALLPQYRERLTHAQVALTILVGKTPAEWTAPRLKLAAITLPANLPVALPSDLLRQRPDILAAEAEMNAAAAQVGIATANLYPQMTLTAELGKQGLLQGGATGSFFNIFGGVTAPIFNGGMLKAQKRASEAAYHAVLAQYQHTVVTAFGQVAESMYRLSTQADEEEAQRRARDSANSLYELTWQGYKAGKADYVRVLVSRRAQQQATLAYLQANAQRYEASVTLLLAVGSG